MHRRLRSRLFRLLPTIALLLSLPAAAHAAPRLALVVGNAAYPARPLATTANDAALVAQALAQAGFDVTAARDLDDDGVRATFAAFVAAARTAGPEATILVYLAGYGVQYDGDNYFVPVDARLAHDDDVPRESADLDDLGRALAAVPARTRIFVFDLARANPFATADEMPLAAGLALGPAPKGSLVAFNAAPGMVAPQDAPPYGAYARALAEMIGTPGVSANALFDRVRLRVGELTDGDEVPWDDGTVDAAPLLPAGEDAPTGPARSIDAIPVDALSPDIAYSAVVARDSLAGYAAFVRAFSDGPLNTRVSTLLAVRREALIAQAALHADDPRAEWTYMRRYPRGPHRFDARRRLAALHAPLEPPPRFDVVAFPDLQPPPRAELKLVAAPLEALRGLPPIPSPPPALLQPADADYYDALPPPAPAPAGLLPIAAPLARPALPADGSITQARPGKGAAVTQTFLEPGGDATLTLADADQEIAKVATSTPKDGMRLVLETGAKNAVLSRTTIARALDGSTSVQTGANGGVLYVIATRADPDGGRVTRVTNGRDELLASWRRNSDGIVVAREIAGGVPAPVAGHRPIAPTPILPASPLPNPAPRARAPVLASPADMGRPAPAPSSPPPHTIAPARSAASPPILAAPATEAMPLRPQPAMPPRPAAPILPEMAPPEAPRASRPPPAPASSEPPSAANRTAVSRTAMPPLPPHRPVAPKAKPAPAPTRDRPHKPAPHIQKTQDRGARAKARKR